MSSAKKNILLVGGAGYLGTHLGVVLSASFNVVYTSRTKKNNYIQLDLLDKTTYANVQHEKFDCIFILASALKGLGTREFREEYVNVETVGLPNFLQFINEHQLTQRLIYTSSMTVYGAENTLPVSESGNLQPLSTYGLSKVLAEKIVEFNSRSGTIKSVVLRIPGIYGGNRASGFIYNTAKKCLNNEPVELNTSGLGYWETIHVDDLCNRIAAFIKQYDWQTGFEIFNLSYGVKTDFVDCAALIKKYTGSTSEISSTGEKGYVDFYMDNAKISHYSPAENTYETSLQQYIKSISQ